MNFQNLISLRRANVKKIHFFIFSNSDNFLRIFLYFLQFGNTIGYTWDNFQPHFQNLLLIFTKLAKSRLFFKIFYVNLIQNDLNDAKIGFFFDVGLSVEPLDPSKFTPPPGGRSIGDPWSRPLRQSQIRAELCSEVPFRCEQNIALALLCSQGKTILQYNRSYWASMGLNGLDDGLNEPFLHWH